MQKLADYTAANDAQEAAITVDTSVDSAPRIQQVISDGHAMITGDFTEEQARGLASALANGPLPVELTVASSDDGNRCGRTWLDTNADLAGSLPG